jgi:Ca-activated chloride channel family protein
MLHFQWLWLLILLPLPFFIRRWLPADEQSQQAALKVPFLDEFAHITSTSSSTSSPKLFWLAFIAWSLLVIAVARPQWLGEPIEQTISGRDLMLAVDVSGSMAEEDFVTDGQRVDRLTATKYVASQFIQRRKGDRIGLILFGTTAHVQTPLTFDRKTVITLLNEAFIGITDDEPATSIGDAIGLAVKRLNNNDAKSRVLILLTDGANTAGEISPLQAAKIAADNNLKIYTIGIGADEMLKRSFFGYQKFNPSRDLDERTLTQIAEKTGGQYFRARNTEELEKIYQILDKLEPVEKESQYFRPMMELYPYPLVFALLFLGFIVVRRIK